MFSPLFTDICKVGGYSSWSNGLRSKEVDGRVKYDLHSIFLTYL